MQGEESEGLSAPGSKAGALSQADTVPADVTAWWPLGAIAAGPFGYTPSLPAEQDADEKEVIGATTPDTRMLENRTRSRSRPPHTMPHRDNAKL